MHAMFRSRLFWIAFVGCIVALLLPLKVSGYILGLLTVAYYFGVFSMAWDLLFGFAGEVNFGPTFLIGLGAYTAGILNGYGVPVYPCIAAGAVMAVIGGVVLALPALRLRGPYFGLTTLVAVLIMMNLIVVFAGFTGGEIGLTVPDVLVGRRGHQLLHRADLHDCQRHHSVCAVALAGRTHPAGERAGPDRSRRARLQCDEAQAHRLHHQRVLLRPRRRAARLLHGHGVGRHAGVDLRRRAGDHRRRAWRPPHDHRRGDRRRSS